MALPIGGFRASSLVFTFGGIVLFAASALNPATLQNMRMGATDLLAPAMATLNAPFVAAARYVDTLTGLSHMQSEINALRTENARLREWHAVALNLQGENKKLSNLLRLQLPQPANYISARVISDAGNAFARSVLVLAGQPEGVAKGQAVLTADGLVGRITQAGEKASRVLLLTDINSRVPVVIEGTQTRAILAGQNHAYPLLDHLPLGYKPVAGQRVVTSGDGGLFMPGLPVGQTFIDEHGRVYVQLFANPDSMTYVRIIGNMLDQNVLEGKILPPAP